jgi:hypothetical protein
VRDNGALAHECGVSPCLAHVSVALHRWLAILGFESAVWQQHDYTATRGGSRRYSQEECQEETHMQRLWSGVEVP